jgi:ferric-dicitrate binding protein FerR (iron transport regulator)
LPEESLDRLEALLRATGRRPAVPEDRAARVATVAREHWRSEIRQHARRRRAWLGASVAAAIGLAAGVAIWQRGDRPAPLPVAEYAARVEVVQDSAWAQTTTTAAPLPLGRGDEVNAGSELATAERGRLALRLATGHSVRLDARTRVSVLSDRVIALTHGAVYVDSASPSGAAAGFVEIRTPLGSIRDVGTQFEVRWLTTSLRVRVREGKIALDGAGTSVEVEAGHELELGENGRIVTREWTASEAGLEWIGGVTPPFPLEGRSLQQFLEWIARERGLQLRFASPDVASAAPEIRLNGSIDGMTLDEALESVLLTCRMAHRVDGGTLLIQSSREPSER